MTTPVAEAVALLGGRERVAELVGVDGSTVWRWCQGAQPRKSAVAKLRNALIEHGEDALRVARQL